MKSQTIINILDCQENILAGMTLKQLVLAILGIALVVGAYLLTRNTIHMQVASYLAIGAGLPCFLFAFAKPKGKKFEVFLVIWIRFQFSNRKRVFRHENTMYDAVFTKTEMKREDKKNAKVENKEK